MRNLPSSLKRYLEPLPFIACAAGGLAAIAGHSTLVFVFGTLVLIFIALNVAARYM